MQDTIDISIHAPGKGSDKTPPSSMTPWQEFQSTLPVKGATAFVAYLLGRALFQSTLPVKGATSFLAPLLFDLKISIHAPGKGSDRDITSNLYFVKFQSTLPVMHKSSKNGQ